MNGSEQGDGDHDEKRRDPASSMALLQEVLDRPLDPGYASAAEARSAQGLPASTGSRSLTLLVAAVVLGFLLTVAAQVLRQPDPEGAATRAGLIDRIRAEAGLGDTYSEAAQTLRAEVATLEQQARDPGPRESRRDEDLLAQVGAVAVHGPGVELVLDDPAAREPEPDGPTGSDRVLARDLQVVVNGLWSHGAEAIAVNDLRLTSTSSIRFAGEAIVVDFRGLTRPYRVVAIGDPQALTAELESGPTGQYLTGLVTDYAIRVEVSSAPELTVPGAARLTTRVATVPAEEDP